MMVKLATYYLKDSEAAIDLVQEIFTGLWHKRESNTISSNTKAYLLTSVRNRCLNKLTRKTDVEQTLELLDNVHLSENDTQQQLDLKDTQQVVTNAIDQLPEKCREIFILSRYDELSYKEISELLGISIKTVEGQISSALKFLRLKLGKK